MNIINEILEYVLNCKNILRQIKKYGDNLEFETWIHRGTIKINDEFTLKTPDIHFDIVKYDVLLVGATRYRFTLHHESKFMSYPKHRKLFDVLFGPTIFRACINKYNKTGKQK